MRPAAEHPPAESGRRRTLASGMQLSLDEAPGVWRVESGAVEVFAASAASGRLDAHWFVARAEPGSPILSAGVSGGAPAAGPSALGLSALAVGDAILVEPAEHDRAPIEALDGWVERLSQSVAQALDGSLAPSIAIARGERATLSPGEAARAARGVAWVSVLAGSGRLFGDAAAPVTEGEMIPLTVAGWVEAGPDGLSLGDRLTGDGLPGDGLRGDGLARADPLLAMAAMERFQAMALGVLERGLEARAAAEAGRIQRSTAQSGEAFGQAFARFAGVLGHGQARERIAAGDDPLQAACRLVASHMGQGAPRSRPFQGADATLSLQERMVRLTRMPVREVSLYGAWWREELGAMIGFEAETGAPLALLPGKGGYAAVDPSTGVARLPEAVALKPAAYVLYPTLPERPLDLRDLVRFAAQGSGRDIATLVWTVLAGALLSLAAPVASGVLVDIFIPDHLKGQLFALGAGLLAVTVVQFILKLTSDTAQLRLFARGGARLQAAVVDRSLRLPSEVLNRFSSVDLAQRVQVVDEARRGLGLVVVDALIAGLFAVANLGLLYLYAPGPALLATGVGVLFLAVLFVVLRSQVPALVETEAAAAESGQLANQFVETIVHLRVGGAEERAFARWGEAYAGLQAAFLRVGRINAGFSAFSSAYEILAFAALFAGLMWLRPPGATTGDLVTMIAAFGAFVPALLEFGRGLRQIAALAPKYRRARVLLEAECETDVSRQDPGRISGAIQVSNVVFGYDADAAPVLDGVSLVIEPGEFVAFVGASGCGKSTLMRIMLGFAAPQGGAVFYDGQDIKRIDVQALRRQIGVVMQSGQLMPGSIGENILGVNNDSSEAAWDAARRAGLAEDIEAMPMGMHTPITDGDATLSGGQVQRLLIARALAAHPRVLFMDEATSALDNRTQAIVTERLAQMAITRVVIAHRLSTIQHADRIFVLADGKIVQTGTFAELSSTPGLFSELVERQRT